MGATVGLRPSGASWVVVVLGAVLLGACGEVEVLVPAGAVAGAVSGRRAAGVCPPFELRAESGEVINPISAAGLGEEGGSVVVGGSSGGVAAGALAEPYSPRQTCGREGCHDYARITEGYHFTQGAGEVPPDTLAERALWVTSPGNYGGAWCSPAPLYRYLSPKQNESAASMDMTSFSFLAEGCGACHPGGGSAELDRAGKRYDAWMADPRSGLQAGADNGFDGDYYQARWTESGVLEADCLICHLPGYQMQERRGQIERWNYRWAATAGAGLAEVTGSVKEGGPVEVRYDVRRFAPDGKVDLHLVREPGNEACLGCHAKPGWKKRGANFRPRTDVHLRAGLKCVDCHPAGSRARDPRIRGREVHQIAKGDDPGGLVRDDLDGTVLACESCHATGERGAPVARHDWLPPLHLDALACQACHIPERAVKAALVQASDVFNPGARIPSKGKHLWTFYGPDGRYWNHYGDLEMMGYDDKPTDPFRPVYIRYEGKIRPANRVHSAWPAIEVEGKPGLMQPRMGDIYKMWAAHRSSPTQYPTLASIRDDNGDGVPEVDRPEEIDALISAVTERLREVAYPLDGKRVVWVSDERVYASGTEYRTLDKRAWEASPYANVHTYNHDVAPARAALGSGGCIECHGERSPMLAGAVLDRAFGADGARPTWQPNHELLGLSASAVRLGTLREAWLKPSVYWMLALTLVLLLALGLRWVLAHGPHPNDRRGQTAAAAVAVAGVAALALLAGQPDWTRFLFVSRFALDASHGWVALLAFALPALAASLRPSLPTRRRAAAHRAARFVVSGALGFSALCGVAMVTKAEALGDLGRFSYTGLEMGFLVALVAAAVALLVVLTAPAAGRPESSAAPAAEQG